MFASGKTNDVAATQEAYYDYTYLAAHIGEEDLTTGATCEIDL